MLPITIEDAMIGWILDAHLCSRLCYFITTESRRVAELLSQLPAEVDVEGMVEASWKAVLNERLDRGENQHLGHSK